MKFFETDDSLFNADEVTGRVTSTANYEFQPWHKPRKQYIRDKQWLGHLIRVLRTGKYNRVDTIKYFGLPGGDLLDINYIHTGLASTSRSVGKKIGFHGIINNKKDYERAQGELSKLLDNENISKASRVDNLDFEDLKSDNSEAWVRVKNFGPYHFINLDFCNNILNTNTLISLHLLLEYQMQAVFGIPWLLCLTTRLNKDSANREVIKRFEMLLEGLSSNVDVLRKIEDCFKEGYKYVIKLQELENVTDKHAVNETLQIFLVLWLIKSAIARKNKVLLKSSFNYSVDLFNRDADMHSFVFSFEKDNIILPDALGLVKGSTETKHVQTLEEAANLAFDYLSKSTLNVDDYLEQQPEALEKYVLEMMILLDKCGYDVSNYREHMNKKYGYACKTA